jgi:hypothetical protein
MRSSLFGDVTQHRLVADYKNFGTTYRLFKDHEELISDTLTTSTSYMNPEYDKLVTKKRHNI